VRDFLRQVERPARRVRLGVEVLTVPLSAAQRDRLGLPAPAAALVTGVETGSPAERAGLLPGDLIVAVADQPIVTAEHLVRARVLDADATDLRLTVMRGGNRLDLGVVPELQAA
jgi:serine protease Do